MGFLVFRIFTNKNTKVYESIAPERSRSLETVTYFQPSGASIAMSSSVFTKWFQSQVKNQQNREKNAQTFILEPIYTPSGLVDGGDDAEAIEVPAIDDLEDLSENTEEMEAIDATEVEDSSDTEDTSDTEDSSDTLDTTDASHISDEDIGEDIPFIEDDIESEDTTDDVSATAETSDSTEDDTTEEPVAAETTTEKGVEDDATEEVVAEEESSQADTSEDTVVEESESSTDDETSEDTVAEDDETSEDTVAEESESSTDDETSEETVAEDDANEDTVAEDDEELDEEATAEDEELDEEDEEILDETPKFELPNFNSGVFTVGESGEVGIDFLYDGGKYRGEVAIFSLAGLDELEFETVEDFIAEAANRAASGSDLGHIVISDPSEGARFNGSLEGGEDWNSGNYQGVKTFTMKAGEKFGVMLVPNGRVSEVVNNPEIGGAKRPLFSLSTANPDDEFHIGQIADVTGDGNTFVMEDMRADDRSDRDYNDLIFQVRGAKGQATYIGNVINSNNDWRTEDMGKALLAYSEPYITPDPVQIDLTEAVETELDVTEGGEDATVEEGSEIPAEDSDESVVTEAEADSEAVDEEAAVEDAESEAEEEPAAEVSRPVVEESETVEETASTDTVEETEASTAEPVDESDATESEESATEAVEESEEEVTETVDAVEETQEEIQESNSSEPIVIEDKFEFAKEDQPDIGIIDTGFAANNPDLDYDNITQGTNVVDGDDNPFIEEGEGSEHGTHVLGIIAAEQDNGEGIDGINDDAPIWVGRAIGSGKWAESLVEFVNHAKESSQPNAVVNLSLDLTQIDAEGNVTTRYEFTPQERAAIEYARQNNVLIVAAAGNDGGVMSVLGQASQEFDNIITVGAAERVNDEIAAAKAHDRADYSSYGQGLGILARGGTNDNPELSLTGDGVGTMAGTSVATAKVTGAISQVWAANPELSYRQVIQVVKDTATDLGVAGFDNETGAGLLNRTAAVLLAKATTPEAHFAPSSVIPDSWSGEGTYTAGERAVKIHETGQFHGQVTATIGANLRGGSSTSYGIVGSASYGKTLTYDAWQEGEYINYPGLGATNRWYRIAGTNQWISAAITTGNPPAVVTPPPSNNNPPSPPPAPGYSTVENPILSRVDASYFNARPQYYTSGNIFALSMYGSSLVGGRGYTEGNCTWYAHGRVLELGGNKAALQSMRGNANEWHTQISNGTQIVSSPRPGDIAQWTSGGANHVAVVEKVNDNGTIVISESHWKSEMSGSNYLGRNNGTLHNVRTISASNPDRFLRVPGVKVENNNGYSTPPVSGNTFTGRVIATIGAYLRATPNKTGNPVGSANYGATLTFDKAITGEYVSYPGLGTASDQWYKIAGKNQWISAALIHGSPQSSVDDPSAKPGEQMQYIVKPGDTLWGIAYDRWGDGSRWRELQKADGSTFTDADARNLRVGQSVYIPVSYESGTGQPIENNPPSSDPGSESGINWVDFTGWVGPSQGVNLRHSPRHEDRSNRNEPYRKTLEFDGWKYGETVTDIWLGTPDSRWFKVKGTNYWVPSAYIWGNPSDASDSPENNENSGEAEAHVDIDSELIDDSPQPNYWRFWEALEYMVDEMKTNVNSSTANDIRNSNNSAKYHLEKEQSYFWNILKKQYHNAQYIYHQSSALLQWAGIVKTDAEWDHKPKLTTRLELNNPPDYYFPIPGGGNHEYYYDIWSNIHYGYVGASVGFDRSTLQFGANLHEQFTGVNDDSDVIAVDIGISLWQKYAGNISKNLLHELIISHKDKLNRTSKMINYV
ncbi:S8 family serine peptidase [Geitlerinema sp. CS-897]|nr:S8 family serine peptidase [Geitlerinema sp. CS-897]